MVNRPLIRPYLLGGGGIGGVPLDSHEMSQNGNLPQVGMKIKKIETTT